MFAEGWLDCGEDTILNVAVFVQRSDIRMRSKTKYSADSEVSGLIMCHFQADEIQCHARSDPLLQKNCPIQFSGENEISVGIFGNNLKHRVSGF